MLLHELLHNRFPEHPETHKNHFEAPILHNNIRKVGSFRNRQVSGSSPLVGSTYIPRFVPNVPTQIGIGMSDDDVSRQFSTRIAQQKAIKLDFERSHHFTKPAVSRQRLLAATLSLNLSLPNAPSGRNAWIATFEEHKIRVAASR